MVKNFDDIIEIGIESEPENRNYENLWLSKFWLVHLKKGF